MIAMVKRKVKSVKHKEMYNWLQYLPSNGSNVLFVADFVDQCFRNFFPVFAVNVHFCYDLNLVLGNILALQIGKNQF